MSDLRVVGATALVLDPYGPPLADAWLLLSDGRVQAAGTGPPPAASTTIDARGSLVMPGLVCAHHHLFQGTSRGIATTGGLEGWLRTHYARWQHLDADHVAAAARLSLAQLVLRGATTVAAFEFLHPPGEDLVSPVVEAAEALGPRLLYVRGTAPALEPGLAERLVADGVDVTRLLEPPDLALPAIEDVVARVPTDRLRFACGPTTPLLDDPEFHVELDRIARAHGVPIHVHLHPLGVPEGTDPVELAASLNLLRRGNVFAHGSRLTTEDVTRLGAAGVGVVHCPSASLLLDYPLPDLAGWCAGNPRVAVGVDGSASNDRGSLIGEAQLAFYTQGQPSLRTGHPRLSAEDALALVTTRAAAALGWDDVGRLTDGALGDVVMFRLDDLDAAGVPWTAERALPGFFRTYQGARADTVLVGGVPVVSDGRLPGTLEHDIAIAAQRSASELGGTPVGRQETRG